SRCRVAPDLPEPEARGFPLPGGSGLPPRRVAQSFLCAGGSGSPLGPRAQEFSRRRVAPEVLLPVARGPSFAGWLRGFPLCQWLGVSPSPATVPGGEEISTPVRAGRTRGLRQQFQDSLAVHKPSTVNPGLSPATGVLSTEYSTARSTGRPGWPSPESGVPAGEPEQRVEGVADVGHVQYRCDDEQVIPGGQPLHRRAFKRRQPALRGERAGKPPPERRRALQQQPRARPPGRGEPPGQGAL